MESVHTSALKLKTINITPAALDQFTAWYKRRKMHVDQFRASFEAREDAHVLRVAALLSVNDNCWQIQAKHISLAIKLVSTLKTDAHQLFTGTFDKNRWVDAIEHMRAVLSSNGHDFMPMSVLWIKCRRKLDYNEFQSLIETMHESGYVERHVLAKENSRGRPIELVRATKLIRAHNLADSIVTNY